MNDLRFAFRQLRKSPGFTLIVIVTLALGIGANTAIFSAINALLFRPLPVKDIDRVVFTVSLREGFDPFACSLLEYAAYRDRSHSFSEIGVGLQRSFNLIGRGEPERLRGAAITLEYLSTLGVKPMLGRIFTAEENQPGGALVALISFTCLQTHFGGGSDTIGQIINLDGRSYSVIGVMPPGFDLPGAADVWVPMQLNIDAMPLTERGATRYDIVGRLKARVTVTQADSELKAIDRQLEKEYPDLRRGQTVKVISLRQDLLGDLEGRVNKALFALVAGVAFLLLICCANVANLLLARRMARERELALRLALGASRWRLVRQLFSESMMLAVVGGVAGLLLAYWMAPILAALNPIRDIAFGTFFHHFEIDTRVLGFALVVTLLTGAIFGLLPAIKGSTESDLIARIKQGEQRSGGAASGRRWLNGLIVTEIAIAMTLLICGGLILQSFHRLQHVELGFNPDNLLTMKMFLPAAKYSERRQRVAVVDQLLDRVRRSPGVISAGVTTNIPLEREITYDARFEVEGRAPAYPGEIPITSHRLVSPGYLRALGVTLIKGRLLEESDRAETLPVLVISQELARQAWPNDDPIGKHVRSIRAGRTSPWMTVVGVVRDVKEDLFNYRINRPVWYLPYAQAENDFPINLVVRASLNPTSLTAAVRDVVRSVDPDQPVSNVMTMRENLGGVLVIERFSAILLGGLAATGLLLASIGLYGVMAYSVSQRTAEIGLRVAVGAEPRHIRGLILEQGMKLTLCGIGIGFLSAWCAARFVAGLLFGLSATDLATFSGIAFALAAVGLLACYLPARSAMRMDPLTALRHE